MKLVTVKDLHAMPVGTVYMTGVPWAFDRLCIKGQSCNPVYLTHDWMYCDIGSIDANDCGEEIRMLEHALESPHDNHIPLDLYTEGRDGMCDDERVALVFDPEDIDALIERLQKAKAGIDSYAD